MATTFGTETLTWTRGPAPSPIVVAAARSAIRYIADAYDWTPPEIVWVRPQTKWDRDHALPGDLALERTESTNGWTFTDDTKTVYLANDLDEVTAAHVAAHEMGHIAQVKRGYAVTEENAEAAAAIVCRAQGNPCSRAVCGGSDSDWLTPAQRIYARAHTF